MKISFSVKLDKKEWLEPVCFQLRGSQQGDRFFRCGREASVANAVSGKEQQKAHVRCTPGLKRKKN